MNMAKYFPNFFIIGVPKSGTTALKEFLSQHPQVFLPKEKEPNTFIYQRVDGEFTGPPDYNLSTPRKTMQQYISLFEDADGAQAIGESSFYLYSDNALRTLREIAPNAKFIIIFRNPADRAYSNYIHLRRTGEESVKDFQEALTMEEKRRANGAGIFWFYKANGLYTANLKEYFNAFPKDHFYIMRYEDWKANNQKYLREIFKFLNVDHDIYIETKNYNESGIAKIPKLGKFLYSRPQYKMFLEKIYEPILPKALRYRIWSKLEELNRKTAPMMDPQIRIELIDFYREDILELQGLIEMDLSQWLK